MFMQNPEFGNTFTLDTGATIKRSLDGTLIVDTHRNQFESFSVSFTRLSRQQRDDFLNWVEAVIGEEVTMTDHEGFDWLGFIVNDNIKTQTQGQGCMYSCEFTFQGERQ